LYKSISEEIVSRHPSVTEMMLYRTGSVQPVHCPITGRHTVDQAAARHAGEAEGCPNESMLNFKLSETREMRYQCLGLWTGENGMLYLSLLDMQLPQLGEKPRPRYRCAIYQADRDTGVTHMCQPSRISNIWEGSFYIKKVPKQRYPV
jgi:hypothetical protein